MNEILFGIHYSENDENWQRIQKLREDGIKEIQVATPVNFLPWLRHLGMISNNNNISTYLFGQTKYCVYITILIQKCNYSNSPKSFI